MENKKTKAIKNLEEKMGTIDASSLRYQVLEKTRDFKTSWIELGHILYTIQKQKMYKSWGYEEFDSFASKEIGIRKDTAFKLVRSYMFLKKEKPEYLQKDYQQKVEAPVVPTYEAVDELRKVSAREDISKNDLSKVKKYVLEEGRDVKDIKKEIKVMTKKNAMEKTPEEREKENLGILNRFAGLLRGIKKRIGEIRGVSPGIAKTTDELIEKLEEEVKGRKTK